MPLFTSIEHMYEYVKECLTNNEPIIFDYESLSEVFDTHFNRIRQYAFPPQTTPVKVKSLARRRDRKIYRALKIGAAFDDKAFESENGTLLEGRELSARISVLFTYIYWSFTLRQKEAVGAFEEIKNNIMRALLLANPGLDDPNQLRRNDDIVPININDWISANHYIDRFCDG